MPRLVHKHLDFFPGRTASLWKTCFKGGKNSNHPASNMVSGVRNPWDSTALCPQDSCELEWKRSYMCWILIDEFHPPLWQREASLHLAEVGHEVARADEVTGPGPQWALRRDILYATAYPSTLQTQQAQVLPALRYLCCPTEAASISKSDNVQGK